MIGWGTTLLLVGRIALRRNDVALTKSILLGVAVWLLVEAALPLMASMRAARKTGTS